MRLALVLAGVQNLVLDAAGLDDGVEAGGRSPDSRAAPVLAGLESSMRAWIARGSASAFLSPSIDDSSSDFSIDVVPTRTGWPLFCAAMMSITTATYFSSTVR
jgi:hypothetical protein